MRVSGSLVEGLALAVIGGAVTYAGRAMLAQLHVFEPAALVVLWAGVIACALSIRRVLHTGGDVRADVTVRAAYLTALLLAIVATIAPARWSSGAAIALVDIAIAFDLFTRATIRRAE